MAFPRKLRYWLFKTTDYNLFADDFSDTRKKAWPEMRYFQKRLLSVALAERQKGTKKKVLDAGCGNGRAIPLLEEAGAEVYGIDAAEKMIEIARQELPGRNIFVGRLEQVPFENAYFDGIFVFASIHHLSTRRKRQRAMLEAFRVLRPGGFLAGTVWNLDQERFKKQRKQARRRAILLPWWSPDDLTIPWGNNKLPRLYHRFTPIALDCLLSRAGFENREIFSVDENGTSPPEGNNICFWARRPDRIQVLGVPFDPVQKEEALQLMHQYAEGERQMFVITPNPEICMTARKDPEYRRVLQSAHLSVPDGIGILWAADFQHDRRKSRLLSLIRFAFRQESRFLPERVCGSDLFRDFCRSTSQPVFLLGGAPGVAEKCREIFRHCGTKIAGTDCGSSSMTDEQRILQKIHDSGARVLFVAFGAPAQEQWIARNLGKLPDVKLAMGVGGSFDFVAGVQTRAPTICRKTGLEWLWRLCQEPGIRFRRIFTAVWSFPKAVARDKHSPKQQN